MIALAAVAAGLLVVAGLIGVLAGWQRRTPRTRVVRGVSLAETWARVTRRPPGARGRRRDVIGFVSLGLGFVVAAVSGWIVAIGLLPALALGLPYLLTMPKSRDVELLEAMDRWVRSLASTLSTGKSIPDAIRISRRTAPALIADEVTTLVVRLNNRWETRDALMRFADALDSPDSDGVIAALMLAANRGANGAATTLQALADSSQAQLKGRRVIEVERSKPYVIVRQITVISMVTLAGVYVVQPAYFAPYRSPLGQLILAVLIVLYIGSLLLMRRKAGSTPRARILIGPQ
jgi:tight adherence protein B